MPKFIYTAKNLKGEITKGDMMVGSLEQLKDNLRTRGYFVTEYKKVGNEFSLKDLFSKVKSKDLSVITRQFSVLLKAGVNLLEAINIIRQQTDKSMLSDILATVYDDIRKGTMLSAALVNHPDAFPEFMINMIKVGEVSGNLDEIMMQLSEYYDKDHKLRAKVSTAMVYPVILMLLTFSVVILLMVMVVPIFANTLSGLGAELPLITNILLWTSEWFTNNFFFFISSIGLVVISTTFLLKTDKGKLVKDNFKIKAPIIGTLNKKVITARFARSLGTLLKSGITIVDAFDIMSNLIGNKAIEANFSIVKEELRKGFGVAVPLSRLNVFPPLLINMVAIGEKSGEMDEMLNNTADFFESEVDEAVTRATTFIEPILIISLALIVGSVLMAVMLPMVSIMENIY